MLDLDTRQRAMLEEMGVKVWWPEMPAAETPAEPEKTVLVATTSRSQPFAAPEQRPVATAESPVRVMASRPPGIAAMDWAQLQTAVSGCQACTLCSTRKNTVFGIGPASGEAPPQVDWLVVGEAPGENEDLKGEPFVGQAGKLLDNMLKAIGLSRDGAAPLKGAYIANVLKCRPPGNRNPAPEEVAQCLPYLARQVALLQPKIIVAAGRFAAQALLQDSVSDVASVPLGKLRGTVHQFRGVPVVVTYHPAYLLRALPEKAKAWADLCLALEVLQKAGSTTPAG